MGNSSRDFSHGSPCPKIMKVNLLAWTPAPELVVAAAGKGCYSSAPSNDILEGIDNEAAAKFIQ